MLLALGSWLKINPNLELRDSGEGIPPDAVFSKTAFDSVMPSESLILLGEVPYGTPDGSEFLTSGYLGRQSRERARERCIFIMACIKVGFW